MFARISSRAHALVQRAEADLPPLTPAQRSRRRRWQDRWTIPIIVAAILPLFTAADVTFAVEVVVGIGTWLIFLVDLIVQRRIDRNYLRRPAGWFDLGILILTFPFYLLPGVANGTGFLVIARFARVVRVLVATAGLRRFAARLGKVAVVASLVVVVGGEVAYRAEHPVNELFATHGDALWWAVVTLTTVGYGDIYPITTTGRVVAGGIMLTGVAVLGILAGSLASLFGVSEATPEEEVELSEERTAAEVRAELQTMHANVRALEARLAAVIARPGAEDGG